MMSEARRQSIREAQQRYAERHPDRIKAAQTKYAKKKWQETKQSQRKLAAKRRYQRDWTHARLRQQDNDLCPLYGACLTRNADKFRVCRRCPLKRCKVPV